MGGDFLCPFVCPYILSSNALNGFAGNLVLPIYNTSSREKLIWLMLVSYSSVLYASQVEQYFFLSGSICC
jgi:hypothetical protein